MADSKQAVETLIYRRNRLDWKYEQIKKLLAGSDESFRDLIVTRTGKYSKAKIKKLVNDMIESLKEYRSYNEADRSVYGNKIMKTVTLSKEEQSFYEAFFRMMTGLALYNPNGPDAKRSAPGTWNAIIERIEWSPWYRESAEIYRDMICYFSITCYLLNNYTLRIPEGICYDIMCAYSAVTGRLITELIPDADRKHAFRLMTDREVKLLDMERKHPGTIKEIAKKAEEENNAIIEELLNDMDEPFIYDDEDYFDPSEMNAVEMDDFLESISYFDDDDENEAEWERYFSDKELFINDCRILLDKMPDMLQNHNLRDEALNAVYLYLAKNGITGWLNDDEYFTVYTYLNKTLKASKSHMGR